MLCHITTHHPLKRSAAHVYHHPLSSLLQSITPQASEYDTSKPRVLVWVHLCGTVVLKVPSLVPAASAAGSMHHRERWPSGDGASSHPPPQAWMGPSSPCSPTRDMRDSPPGRREGGKRGADRKETGGVDVEP